MISVYILEDPKAWDMYKEMSVCIARGYPQSLERSCDFETFYPDFAGSEMLSISFSISASRAVTPSSA